MNNVNITYEGPVEHTNLEQTLNPTIQAAFSWLSQYVTFGGTQDVVVIIEETASGRFGGTGLIHDYIGKVNGFDTWKLASLSESETGIDVDPLNPEFIINVDPNSTYLEKLWWDPTPLSFSKAEVPTDKTDGFTVVLHELLHGMGISGWLNQATGEHTGNDQSVWDSLISKSNNKAYFTGNQTTALLGEPVEVRLGGSQGSYHLGAEETQQPYLLSSIMNSYSFRDGERYLPARLEFAILEDLGWELKPAVFSIPHIIDPFDDNSASYIGYTLNGTLDDDFLIGGLGDDTLRAGLGSDNLVGGEGNDTFSIFAAGSFTIQDFDMSFDLLAFETQTTGIRNIEDLLQVVTGIENTNNSVVIHFIEDIASITLIGLQASDLTIDMVTFI